MAIKSEVFQSREDWLQARGDTLGCSEIPAALGLNPWKTPYQLWAEKCGYVEGPEMNFRMRLGLELEPAVCRLFMEDSGRSVEHQKRPIIFRNEAHPFLHASPDAFQYQSQIVVDGYELMGAPGNLPGQGRLRLEQGRVGGSGSR